MTCRYYRWKISKALDADRPEDLPRDHMDRCEACREFHRRSLRLAQSLRDDAMLLAYRPEASPTGRSRRQVIVLRVIQAAAACLALAALLIAFRPARPPRESIVIAPPRPSHAAPDAPQLAALLSARPIDSLESLAQAAGRPIREQIDTTTREVRSAGLAMLRCLPSLDGPARRPAAMPRRATQPSRERR